ncbi:CCA tRNA nucleotidyltransferase [Candidatus Margulisiibacteriota bacterium]
MINVRSFPKDLIDICKKIKKAGFSCFVVGGGVRDILLGNKVTNWDIATDATPKDVEKLFNKVIPTGIEFGTVTVMKGKIPYEITTFRSDQRYVDGRHPEKVTFTKDIDKDLSRRDFTINAMAYDPLEGKLIDNYEGQKDLLKKVIRTVGDPVERFNEDGLRPVRACRFAAKLQFNIDKATLEAIPKCLEVAKKVAMERVHDELMRMLEADKPSAGIEAMRQTELLSLFIPELEEGVGMEQPKPFHEYDVYWHSLYSCDYVSKEKPVLRLTALLHDIAKPPCKDGVKFYGHDSKGAEMSEKIMKRLKFSNKDIDRVANLIQNHMFHYTSDWSDAAVRRFMKRVGVENLGDMFELRMADLKAMEKEVDFDHPKELRARIKKVIDEENALHVKDLKVDGKDVMKALGIKPGPEVGEILNSLLEKVLDDPKLNDRKKLTEMIKKNKK